jgi:hypothetical protein
MDMAPTHSIVEAERLDATRVVITFGNGTSALYSADLLLSFLAQAVNVTELKASDED